MKLIGKYLATVCLCFGLIACKPLERKGVPIWYSVYLDDSTRVNRLIGQLKTMQGHGYSKVLLELPLMQLAAKTKTDIALPAMDSTTRNTLKTLLAGLKGSGLHLGLSFTQLNGELLSPGNKAGWVNELGILEAEVLQQDISPKDSIRYVVVGSNLAAVENETGEWESLITRLKTITKAKLIYSTRPQRVARINFWKSLDAIGVIAEYSPEGNYKVYARNQNKVLGSQAMLLHKPIFITQANLIGQDKKLKFNNLLRFWPDSLPIAGLCLNSIYPTPAYLDISSYYGFAHDDELKHTLKDYLEATPSK